MDDIEEYRDMEEYSTPRAHIDASRTPSFYSLESVGIAAQSTRVLPQKFHRIFPYPAFNSVQSKCFDSTYNSDDNFVLSSPTGSGKTVIMELAICRLINSSPSGEFKIVYQGLTKALCSERQRDWQEKFGPLGVKCSLFTGDSDASLPKVRDATIIVTTPEKWDSMTRSWRDHAKLMKMVKLFLIDEVHMLREERGATLEAIVSRMKPAGSGVRFIALSATIPNADDVASWLGRRPDRQSDPALLEYFGQEFRPVQLEKHVHGYKSMNSNPFAFDKLLDQKYETILLPNMLTHCLDWPISSRSTRARSLSLFFAAPRRTPYQRRSNWQNGGQRVGSRRDGGMRRARICTSWIKS
jgi:ATP-dependent DNA helicase HFM1/MER3